MKFVYLLIILLILSGCTVNTGFTEDNQQESDRDVMEDKSDDSMEGSDHMVKEEGVNVLAGDSTKYIEFTQEEYEKALAENKIILLYFYAGWCPFCVAEQSDVKAAFNDLDYDNVVGFRVNYKDGDTDNYEEDLAREFGITSQHTKVILKNGERVLKSPETWNEERYIEEINSVVNG